jgi:hypothetical protein
MVVVPFEERVIEENGAGVGRYEFVCLLQDFPENLLQVDFPSGIPTSCSSSEGCGR